MSARQVLTVLGFAFVGWALCGAIMGIGPQFTTMETTLIVHAIGAPIIFGVLTWMYTVRFGYTTPLQTAVIFTGFVAVTDAVVVAGLVERSFEMFQSVLGTWLPFTLIFVATLGVGMFVGRQRSLRPA